MFSISEILPIVKPIFEIKFLFLKIISYAVLHCENTLYKQGETKVTGILQLMTLI